MKFSGFVFDEDDRTIGQIYSRRKALTVHLHFKVRTVDDQEFTSQLFFDPETTDAVYTSAPYNTRGERTVRNSNDGIYAESSGQMLLNVQPDGDGYATQFDVTLDLSDVSG